MNRISQLCVCYATYIRFDSSLFDIETHLFRSEQFIFFVRRSIFWAPNLTRDRRSLRIPFRVLYQVFDYRFLSRCLAQIKMFVFAHDLISVSDDPNISFGSPRFLYHTGQFRLKS